MTYSFREFLNSDNPQVKSFIAIAKNEMENSIDRYSNAFNDAKISHLIKIPEMDNLTKEYLSLLTTLKLQNPTADEPVLDSVSKSKVRSFLTKLYAVACQELLDNEGNLHPDIVGKMGLQNMEDPPYKGNETEFRNGFLKGFISETTTYITNSDAYMEIVQKLQSNEFNFIIGGINSIFSKERTDEMAATSVKNYCISLLLKQAISNLQDLLKKNSELLDPKYLRTMILVAGKLKESCYKIPIPWEEVGVALINLKENTQIASQPHLTNEAIPKIASAIETISKIAADLYVKPQLSSTAMLHGVIQSEIKQPALPRRPPPPSAPPPPSRPPPSFPPPKEDVKPAHTEPRTSPRPKG